MLRALVRDHLASDSESDKEEVSRAAPSVLPGGAALLSGPVGGPVRAWILIDDGAVGRLGPAMSWAWRQGAGVGAGGSGGSGAGGGGAGDGGSGGGGSVDVLVDGDGSWSAAGIIARRAACFSPAPTVWAVSGRDLAHASPAAPVSDSDSASAESPPQALVSLLASHGLEVVWEHGVLRGEVLGLEVARTVGSRLEVGVGRHDRAARLEMRPSETLDAALEEAARAVRALRRPGAPSHPANTLARSRWLRSVMVLSPGSFGFASLTPVAPPMPWFDLPEAGAAPAVGWTVDGEPAVVVCSVGVDLDLVPTAADCRLLYGAGGGAGEGVSLGGAGGGSTGGGDGGLSGLWLVVPEGDDVAPTRGLADWLAPAARILTVGRGWEEAGGQHAG